MRAQPMPLTTPYRQLSTSSDTQKHRPNYSQFRSMFGLVYFALWMGTQPTTFYCGVPISCGHLQVSLLELPSRFAFLLSISPGCNCLQCFWWLVGSLQIHPLSVPGWRTTSRASGSGRVEWHFVCCPRKDFLFCFLFWSLDLALICVTKFTIGNLFGGLVGSNIFLAREKPYYGTAYKFEISMWCAGIVTVLLQAYLLDRANKKKAATIARAEEEGRDLYDEYKDAGDKSPYFKYTLWECRGIVAAQNCLFSCTCELKIAYLSYSLVGTSQAIVNGTQSYPQCSSNTQRGGGKTGLYLLFLIVIYDLPVLFVPKN